MALPIFIGEKMAKHILSCSFGKDSIATALLALQHGEPLDELVYCEVMFNEEISGELPEHNRFIHETAIPYFEQRGIPTRVLRSEKTYLSCFYHVVTRGKTKGMLSGFPLSGRCTIQRDCKLPPIKAWIRPSRNWSAFLRSTSFFKMRALSGTMPSNTRLCFERPCRSVKCWLGCQPKSLLQPQSSTRRVSPKRPIYEKRLWQYRWSFAGVFPCRCPIPLPLRWTGWTPTFHPTRNAKHWKKFGNCL